MLRAFFAADQLYLHVTQVLRAILGGDARLAQASDAVKRRLATASDLPSFGRLRLRFWKPKRGYAQFSMRPSAEPPSGRVIPAAPCKMRLNAGQRAPRRGRLRRDGADGFIDGKMHLHDRAVAQRRADADCAAMQRDERARDGETQARAFHAIGERRVPLFERPSEPCQSLWRNAHAIVLDINVEGTLT